MATTDFLADVLTDGLELIYKPGLLYVRQMVDNGKGGYDELFDDPPKDILGQTDGVQEYMRSERGFTEQDVSVYILQRTAAKVSAQDEVELDGVRYSLGPVGQDPLHVAWIARGTPKHG